MSYPFLVVVEKGIDMLAWPLVKGIGTVLFILCVTTLILDALPQYQAKRIGMALSWVSWPLFFLWIAGVFIKGFSG